MGLGVKLLLQVCISVCPKPVLMLCTCSLVPCPGFDLNSNSINAQQKKRQKEITARLGQQDP